MKSDRQRVAGLWEGNRPPEAGLFGRRERMSTLRGRGLCVGIALAWAGDVLGLRGFQLLLA